MIKNILKVKSGSVTMKRNICGLSEICPLDLLHSAAIFD